MIAYSDRTDTEEYRIAYLKFLCSRGWKRLIKDIISKQLHPDYKKRLAFELDVLTLKGFISYFLIVQDYVNYAKNNGVTVGPGRGSGAGSLVSYLLGITEVDPIENNLMFERFLSPELPVYDFQLFNYSPDNFTPDNRTDIEPFTKTRSPLLVDPPKLTEYECNLGKSIDRWNQLTLAEQEAALLEYRYIIRQGQIRYFLDLPEVLPNTANSFVHWLWFNTDEKPTSTSIHRLKVLVPGSSSIPDFDVDFSNIYVVQRYLWEKYGGNDHVAIIGTDQTLGSKAALRDVCRVYEVPKDLERAIISSIEQLAGKTGNLPLSYLLKNSPVLQEIKRQHPVLFRVAEKLEGLPRNSSKHAAGMVITTDKLTNHLPLWKPAAEEIAVTQLPWKQVEAMGVPKFDILSLTTLNIIQKSVHLIEQTTGEELDLIHVDHNDPKVWNLFKLGAFCDLFQVDARSAARELTKQLAPTSVADLTALVALNRPGPLQVGLHMNYIRRKHGQEFVEYVLPQMEPILQDTYGVMIYQEQIIEISKVVAGYTTAQADDLRKAISKTDPDIIRRQKTPFLEGCKKNKVDPKLALALFESFVKFGEYCFNRAHSRSYGEITYRTAWLKANYPLQFYTASVSFADLQRIPRYLKEANKFFNIKTLPPDINWSNSDFSCDVNTNTIYYGLKVIKGVGEKALSILIRTRKRYGEFTSFTDFVAKIRRFDTRGLTAVNKRVQEALMKAGAFDRLPYFEGSTLPITRKTYIAMRDQLLAGKTFEEKDIVPTSSTEKQQMELEVLEVTLSGKSLDRYESTINKYKLGTIQEARDQLTTQIAVEIQKTKIIQDRKGRDMCFLEVSDGEDRVSITVFSQLFDSKRNVFQNGGEAVALKVKVEDPESDSFICEGVKRLRELK